MRTTRIWGLLVVPLGLVATRTSIAQLPQQVDTRVNTRADGRLLDANNMVGSGGYNVNSTSVPNSANLLITGNVTAGRSFRGFSPIRDPSQLFLNSPSSSLSNFQRDSIGLGDIVAGRSQAYASPYFSPSTTTTLSGGVTLPSPQMTLAPYNRAYAPPRTDLLSGRPLGLDPGINDGRSPALPWPSTPGAVTPEAPPDSFVAQSPLFGLPRPDEAELGYPAEQSPPTAAGLGLPGSTPASREATRGAAGRSRSLFDDVFARSRAPGPSQPAPTGPEAARDRDLLSAARPPAAAPATTGDLAARPSATTPRGTADIGEPTAGTAGTADSPPPEAGSQAPSGFAPRERSVYEDFQEAVRWMESYNEYRAGLAEKMTELPSVTGEYEKSMSFARTIVEEPPKSFAGQDDSPVNQRIRRAEELMKRGDFYSAASQYEIASTLEPNNPLILLGKGHALIAAGDYLSAVQALVHGLGRFPSVAKFRIDLYDFVPDPNLLDIRRADLETKLERSEDYRLRFLLGYVEYYGGLEKFGLPDLQKAAAAAPADSVIARVPSMLRP